MFNRYNKIASYAFFVFGILSILLGILLFAQRYMPVKYSEESITPSYPTQEAEPVVLSISRLGISQPVIKGTKKGDEWETTTKGVTYYVDSAKPGTEGNSVFYGHNWPAILGKLSKVELGDSITIGLSNGQSYNYRVSEIREVTEETFYILDDTQEATVTVYTCSGFMDSKRLVVTATLASQGEIS